MYSNKKVLIAEDELINLYYLEKILKEVDFTVYSVKNGKEVLESFNNNTFDLILLDIGMPEMSGKDCIEYLRNNGNSVPAIALSGYSTGDDVSVFLSSGFNAVLSKPLDIVKLFETIDRLLN